MAAISPIFSQHSLLKNSLDAVLVKLVNYFEPEDIPVNVLEKELEHYDKHREKVTESVWQFEKAAFENPRLQPHLLQHKKAGLISHENYLSVVANQLGWPQEIPFSSSVMSKIRNKFNHNEIPAHPDVSDLMPYVAMNRPSNQLICQFLIENTVKAYQCLQSKCL